MSSVIQLFWCALMSSAMGRSRRLIAEPKLTLSSGPTSSEFGQERLSWNRCSIYAVCWQYSFNASYTSKPGEKIESWGCGIQSPVGT